MLPTRWIQFLIAACCGCLISGQEPEKPAFGGGWQGVLGEGPQVDRARALSAIGERAPEWQQAVLRAQAWLVRQQADTGAFGPGVADKDRAVMATALAALALQATGSTLRAGAHKDALKLAARYLREQQGDDGRYAGAKADAALQVQAVATWAMADMRFLGMYTLLHPNMAKGGQVLLDALAADGTVRRAGEPDVVAQGMVVVALQRSGQLPAEMPAQTLAMISKLTTANGRIGWQKPGGPAPAALVRGQAPSPVLETATAVGSYARLLCAELPANSPQLQAGIDMLRRSPPLWDEKAGTIDPIYWCFGARVAARAGGECWQVWERDLRQQVLKAQVRDGDDAGSWPPFGPWGEDLGRIGSTALVVLALTAPCTEPLPAK